MILSEPLHNSKLAKTKIQVHPTPDLLIPSHPQPCTYKEKKSKENIGNQGLKKSKEPTVKRLG